MNARQAHTLRPAHRAEAPVLAGLSRDLIEHGLRWRYTPPRIARLMTDADTSVIVACDAQAVQGFVVMQLGDDSAHLVLLAVRPAQQRSGLGRRLMEWQFATARAAGLARIGLELRADNAGARAFYASLGFELLHGLPAYYDGHVAALRMQMVLRETSQPGLA